jgi:isoleucyl-tRNA synthetase
VDQYALHQLFELNRIVKRYYDNYEFFKGISWWILLIIAVQAIQTYTSTSLSREYFYYTKDILYCDSENSPRRRAIQYVLSQVFISLLRLTQILLNYVTMIYPLIPLYAEEAWHYTPEFMKPTNAVYKLGWFEPNKEWYRRDLASDTEILHPLKETTLKILEHARQKQ